MDNDLVFDAFETSNSHDNHPRIHRAIDDTDPLIEEDGYWLASTVNRIKRSISKIFSKDEPTHKKLVSHHKIGEEHQLHKINKNKRSAHSQKSKKRVQRQFDETGQEEGQEEYDVS